MQMDTALRWRRENSAREPLPMIAVINDRRFHSSLGAGVVSGYRTFQLLRPVCGIVDSAHFFFYVTERGSGQKFRQDRGGNIVSEVSMATVCSCSVAKKLAYKYQ